ncbi:hypothetical protein FZX01_05415 [Listeria monocytogenes]|uniref:hypothetical protein n=1 Tax=Listeria monocytogenes TaxID=1639 RepID=UPI0011EB9594|nr:hypothetical protein [Listeria monocytogenes]TYU88948.1 hypothetical protein FZX01_05415 [Listeria monocytogenes]
MTEFDSLGARQEPPEELTPVTEDWQGNEIYAGELIYVIGTDVVLKEELEEYIETTIGKAVEA